MHVDPLVVERDVRQLVGELDALALVGELARWQLYFVVVAIWVLQLVVSPWWLARYRFGPVEWLWQGADLWPLAG